LGACILDAVRRKSYIKRKTSESLIEGVRLFRKEKYHTGFGLSSRQKPFTAEARRKDAELTQRKTFNSLLLSLSASSLRASAVNRTSRIFQ
jgi:hypothetical protein